MYRNVQFLKLPNVTFVFHVIFATVLPLTINKKKNRYTFRAYTPFPVLKSRKTSVRIDVPIFLNSEHVRVLKKFDTLHQIMVDAIRQGQQGARKCS